MVIDDGGEIAWMSIPGSTWHPRRWCLAVRVLAGALAAGAMACRAGASVGTGDAWNDAMPDLELPAACVAPASGERPESLPLLGCLADFEAVASRPLDASIPGARSVKTVIDRADGQALHFQDSQRYAMHYDFCVDRLSGGGLPVVGDLAAFNGTEYYSPYRRFLLGAVTRYEGPGVWAYEIAPYDGSSPQMVADAFRRVREAVFFGNELRFHPTSSSVQRVVAELPADIPVVTSEDLFAGIAYQPLNLGTALGRLRFVAVADLLAGTDFVGPRDVVVLDRVPNDLSAVAGLITAEYQTPLAHVNVLSQNRGTPNMALRGADRDPALKALSGQWVRLVVEAFEYRVEPVSKDEADAWWEAHRPPPVDVPAPDLSVTALADVQDIPFPEGIAAYGGKASHYAELSRMDPAKVPVPPAFGIPLVHYRDFVQQNGFDVEIASMLADPGFQADPAAREAALAGLRARMLEGVIDPAFLAAVQQKADATFPGLALRFRSSTNAEDLDGFTGAGLYDSQTYDPARPRKSVANALRVVWASLWEFRAFEERSYRGIDPGAVAMAILVHRSFPAEDANGVALTANLFDPVQPAFWVNVQRGDTSVVLPPAGVTADQFLYYWYYLGQPMAFSAHSSLVEPGQTVLTAKQANTLGVALDAIHRHFATWYRRTDGFYAMDVEFKFNTDAGSTESRLWIKQARPHPGWGGAAP